MDEFKCLFLRTSRYSRSGMWRFGGHHYMETNKIPAKLTAVLEYIMCFNNIKF